MYVAAPSTMVPYKLLFPSINYNTGYIDGVENLEKFENDLRMETNQKFSTIVSHSRASHSIAKKQRYSEEGLFIKLYQGSSYRSPLSPI